MVHAVIERIEPGEVLVLTMPEPRPVALVGDLLATQAKVAGAAALLVDASVRDVEELARDGAADLGALAARARRRQGRRPASSTCPVTVGGALINPGDIVVLDADGVAVVEAARVEEVLAASLAREEKERVKRAKLAGRRALLRPRRPARRRRGSA